MFKKMLLNLSVRSKLILGFAILMAFTLCIALTGWQGIASVSERSERIADIAKLSTLTRDMRIGRLSYTISNDDERAQTWLKAIENFQEHLKYTRTVLNSSLNTPLLESTSSTLKDYIENYNNLIKATSDRELARRAFTKNADQAYSQLEKLEAIANSPDSSPNQRNASVQMLKIFLKMRFDVRGYTYTLKADERNVANLSIKDTINLIKGVSSFENYNDTTKELLLNLESYRAGVDQFAEAQSRIDNAQANISKYIDVLLTNANELTKNQITLRVDDVDSARNFLIIWILIAITLSIIAAWIITRLIVTPLIQTLGIVNQVASGDLRYSQETDRKDELGLLQNNMKKMTDNLRLLIGGLRDGVIQIASSAEQLSAVTEQTNAGVNSQRNETDLVATAMNEMAATVQEVARSAEQASHAAMSASSRAREGNEIVSQAVAQIEHLAVEVGNSKSAMDDLKVESNKIGGVLDVIRAVAEQTNLLALNAAIEAARAGEAGRGFAVVADEVRSLAQRTQTSTEEIAALINGLHSKTSEVADKLESSLSLSNSSVELTRSVGASISSVNHSVSTIESMNHQIAAAAEEQSAVADEISRSIVHVKDISEKTSSASEETAASSVELARLGVHLQGLVSKFTI